MEQAHRRPLLLSLAASVLFWSLMFGIGSIRPEYSQVTKAISELGVIGAPHAIIFNLFGFLLPGALLAICGAQLARSIDRANSLLWWLLVISGVGFAATAIPAEMKVGSFDFSSSLTRAHLMMTLVSALPWAIAIYVVPNRMKENSNWRPFRPISYALAAGCSLTLIANLLNESLPISAAVGQRLAFLGYFAWFLAMSTIFLVGCHDEVE